MKKILFSVLLTISFLANANFTVIVELHAQEGFEQELLQILLDAKKFVANDLSCLEYRVHQEITDSQSFVLYETWQMQADHQKHHEDPYISRLAQRLKQIISQQNRAIKATEIRGSMYNHGKISFKKLATDDVPLLATWFSNSHVSKWWPVLEKDEGIDQFLKRIRSKDTFGYIVSLDDKPFGYIQYYYIDSKGEKTGKWLPGLPSNSIGIDQFIGDSQCIGKGIGTRMIKEFIAYIRNVEQNATTIIVDPEPTNYAAIRCYEKVGFTRDGIYETVYGSCLLMKYNIG